MPDPAIRDSRQSFAVAVAAIRPDPRQPRKSFPAAELEALARTMADQGQLQPILLRRDPEAADHWIIVAGERRWRAARLNGWERLRAIEHDGDAETAAMIESLQRLDLTAIEEARGLQA